MGEFTTIDRSVRLLGLGNEWLADDAFGIRVAREVQSRFGRDVDVVTSSASGLHLLDDAIGTTRLLVVDTVQTGSVPPGTIHVLTEDQVRPVPGDSPHFLGFFDVLRVARQLGMPVASDVVILVAEAFDCSTFGGCMHPGVERAISQAVEMVSEMLSVRKTTYA
jgi:hydrogenase maturation protease